MLFLKAEQFRNSTFAIYDKIMSSTLHNEDLDALFQLLFTKNSELLRNGETVANLTETQYFAPPSPGPAIQKVAAAVY